MQSKLLKIVTLICLIFIIISIFPNKISADWSDAAQNFINAGGETVTVDNEKLKDASASIYNLLSSIGMIISVIVGIALGITFMMASAEDKAKVKEALVPYIVGCVVVFGAFGIWKIVINTFSGI